MVTITKRFSFCYGHFLPGHEGKCANVHGHNADLEVEVSGYEYGGYEGMIMDFGNLKKVVEPIIDKLDHQLINSTLWGQTMGTPTAENMIRWFAAELMRALPIGVYLMSLSLSETDNSWATWRTSE